MSVPAEIQKPKDVEELKYSEQEQDYRNMVIRDALSARAQRESFWPEFDDMTYEQAYVSNAKASNAYIPPKLNPEDSRTVSGTTREKSNSLVSAFLNYNMEPNILAFDEDDMPLTDLAKAMEDAIKKSRKLEEPIHDVKRPYYLKELVDQGTVFIEEQWLEFNVMRKTLKKQNYKNLLDAKWDEKLEQYCKTATSSLLYGPSVFLGNMRQPYFQLQPFVIRRKELTRAEAKAIYGEWERWKNVPYSVKNTVPTNAYGPYSNWGSWSMVEVSINMVEELTYYNPWNNSVQIMLNGTMMLPIGYPLESLIGECRIPISANKLEPLPFFAYGRGFGHKNKFNQAMADEFYKSMILKTRKSYQPPMANNTGQTLSKKIFYPSNITNGIDGTKLTEIGNNQGVTQSELKMFELIQQVIGESSVTSQFQGQESPGNQTAREVVENKQQQLMKLGLAMLGVINMEIDLAWMRLHNILKHWTEEIDEEINETKDGVKKVTKKYRTESVDSSFDDGEEGQHVLQFTDQELPHPDQLMAQEDILSKRRGVPIRISVLNVDDLRSLKTKWFITVQPTEKDSSDLRTALFMDNITKFMQLFGPEALNLPYAKRRYALMNHEDPEKFLAPQAPQQPGQMQPAPNTQLQSQMLPPQLQKPSLNALAS